MLFGLFPNGLSGGGFGPTLNPKPVWALGAKVWDFTARVQDRMAPWLDASMVVWACV